MKYLVSHQGLELGPLSIDEIVNKVRSKELELFDYVFDETKKDWVLLMEFKPLAAVLKSNRPPRPPQTTTTTSKTTTTAPVTTTTAAADETTTQPKKPSASRPDAEHAITEWFVLKGENRFGPFMYSDLLKMMQQKVVFPFDYIWHTGMENWKRVAEISEFKAETVRDLFAKAPANKDLFIERKHNRKQFNGRVLIHDNLTLWKGEGFEISRGGVGVKMANSLIVPGQQVTVHFKQDGEFPSFNAVCEVVSKKFVDDGSPVQYGLRFLSLTQEVQDEFYKKVA